MANYLIQEETLQGIADAINTNDLTLKGKVLSYGKRLNYNQIDVYWTLINDSISYEPEEGYTFIRYDYLPSAFFSDIVPVLYKAYNGDLEDPDYDEPYYYYTTAAGPDNEIYDWWVKDESIGGGEYTQTSSSRKFILTNRIVHTSMIPITPEEMPNGIEDLDGPYILQGAYVLNSDPSECTFPTSKITAIMGEYDDYSYGAYGYFPNGYSSDIEKIEIGPDSIRVEMCDGYYTWDSEDGWFANYDDNDYDIPDHFRHPAYRIIMFDAPYVTTREFYKAFTRIANSSTGVYGLIDEQLNQAVKGTLSAFWMPASTMGSIRAYAFYSLSTLKIADLAACGSTIGSNAFRYCSNLSMLKAPTRSQCTIGSYAFANTGLREIINSLTPSVIQSYAFYSCSKLQSVAGYNTKTLGTYAFANCPLLSYASFKFSVGAVIGSYAFNSCSTLSTFRIVGSLPMLAASNAFNGTHTNLKIQVPKSLYATATTTTNWTYLSTKMVSY